MIATLKKMPTAALFFLGIELAERASYYGYRALIKPYLRDKVGMSADEIDAIIRSNIALTYLAPVLGGLMADWLIGKYMGIIGFAVICCFGHVLLGVSMDYSYFSFLHGVFPDSFSVLRAGLFLIALGAGGLKPNNSGMFGDQFQGEYQSQIEQGFRWFYASINVGSLLVTVTLPALAQQYSYQLAFVVPAVLILVAILILIAGRRSFHRVAPVGIPSTHFLSFNLEALWLKLNREPNVWGTMRTKYGDQKTEYLLSVWNVIAYFLFFAVIWSLYDMNGAEWVTEARFLDRYIGGVLIPDASVQAANTVFIILLVPISVWFFQKLAAKGYTFTMRKQVFWGMIFVLLATMIEGAIKTNVEFWLDDNPSMRDAMYVANHPEIVSEISMWWQVLAYFFLTIGEILFSIAGLTLGFRYAAPGMKSSVLAIWYLSTSLGNYVAAFVKEFMGKNEPLEFLTLGGNYYWFFCALLVINAILYLWITPRIPEKMYDNG